MRRVVSLSRQILCPDNELQRFLDGEITSLKETAIMGRAVKANNEILRKRFLSLCSPARRAVVLSEVFEELPTQELVRLSQIVVGITSNRSDAEEASLQVDAIIHEANSSSDEEDDVAEQSQ